MDWAPIMWNMTFVLVMNQPVEKLLAELMRECMSVTAQRWALGGINEQKREDEHRQRKREEMRLTRGGKWPCNGVRGGTTTMMGLKERAFAPKVSVSLEELVPQEHFYRHVQKVLDLSFVHDLVRERYAVAGRPSIDPVVFFKLQLVMFFEDIRSERLLMRQVADRLSVRWYLGYDLDEALPDHSSLTKICNRYGVEIFRRFFDTIVEQCQQAGLVWGKELYIDSTKVQANASQASLKPRFFVEAHLSNLFDDPQNVCQESEGVSTQKEESVAEAPESEERQAPQPLPTSLTQQERETLAQSNQERHDWVEQLGAQNRKMTTRGYQRLADLWVSTTDPDATRMETKTGSDMGYRTHYVVDGGKSRIILQVLVAPSEVMDNQPML